MIPLRWQFHVTLHQQLERWATDAPSNWSSQPLHLLHPHTVEQHAPAPHLLEQQPVVELAQQVLDIPNTSHTPPHPHTLERISGDSWLSNWRSRCWSGHSRRSKHLHSSRQVTLSVLHLRLRCEEGVGKCEDGQVWQILNSALRMWGARHEPQAPLPALLLRTSPIHPHTILTSGRSQTAPA